MLFTLLLSGICAPLALAQDGHGEGAEGSIMGPVSFMWPPDRPWAADDDNIGPCGSDAEPGDRTAFPLGKVLTLSSLTTRDR
jgi:hypothetical protein